MGAAADCEAIGAGLFGQPVNTVTTLAFAAAGAVVLVRAHERRWVGIALIATGLGSFLFHGPMPSGSEWAHDVTLAWVLVVVSATGTRWEGASHLPALAGLATVFAVAPALADPIAVGLSVVAIVALLKRDRSRVTVAPLLLLGAVALFGRLGATGWPLCDPDSVLQPHGVWHVGAAAAVAWWALGSVPQPSESR